MSRCVATIGRAVAAAGIALAAATVAFAAKTRPAPLKPLTPGAWAPPETCSRYRPAPAAPKEAVPGFLFVEAEEFADYGRWRLDTQFTHKMGSAYLVASGVGEPIGSATTTVRIPHAGRWRVWARTKDWLPEFSPGAFTVAVDGRPGARLGVSRRVGWLWERAGDFDFKDGEVRIELKDISGYFGRCDALILTADLSYVPRMEWPNCRRNGAV